MVPEAEAAKERGNREYGQGRYRYVSRCPAHVQGVLGGPGAVYQGPGTLTKYKGQIQFFAKSEREKDKHLPG